MLKASRRPAISDSGASWRVGRLPRLVCDTAALPKKVRVSSCAPANRKREDSLSKDGKWRSFPKVPHLLRYVSNGNYYGRIKVGGKLIRESLKTAVW